jgi:hypothetical protein
MNISVSENTREKNNEIKCHPSSWTTTVSQRGGLHAPMAQRTMLVEAYAIGRATHVKTDKGYGPDEVLSLVLQVGDWMWD